MQKTNDVIGIGNALMDFLIEVGDDKLLELDLKKGQFHMIEEAQAKKILQEVESLKQELEIVPGGSVANTLRGVGMLGSSCILVGKVGNDKHADIYEQAMRDHQVLPKFSRHPSVTGHALTFITPDAQRTFSVHLGAAIKLTKEDVLEEDIQKSKILHLEAYQIEGETKPVVLHAIELAKKHNTKISIDLADPGVIERNKELIEQILEDTDIVFLNELEAVALTNREEEHAAKEIAKTVPITIVKVGPKGAYLVQNEIMTHLQAHPANPIDTTGAGDSFAAGVLYGLTHEWQLERAANLGALLAARVIEKKGVHFSQEEVDKVREIISANV